ncbi:tyrosine-type recombinase/integrase [Acinetobacter thermotolerans]|uniref:tyrosine-type recombinase/integrase n=1 Tax=Acinetobacter thermotolerans TaxID=3151487 RepID=UPI00325B8F5C
MLSDAKVRGLKPQEKRYSIADGEGLIITVFPSGKKKWVLSYRHHGKQNQKTLGEYPEIGCRDARVLARDFKAEISGKKLNVPTLAEVIKEWIDIKSPYWTSDKYKYTVIYRLNYISEDFADVSIDEIERKDVVKKVKEIVAKGTIETAKRSLRLLSDIFNFAIASDYTEKNPCILVDDVIPNQDVEHLAALKPHEMPEFWRRVQQSYVTDDLMIALKLACYTAVRISELLHARWDTGELDLQKREWVIPASRMKMRRDHVVPLTDQTVELFKTMYDRRVDDGFIFKHTLKPNMPCRSESILAIIKRNGYAGRMTTHGFRTVFSTMANGSKLFREDVIEYQIAHVPKNKIRGIYNRAEYWPERVELMNWYANQVDAWMKGQ